MALGSNEEILVIGTSDGQIQVIHFFAWILISICYILFSLHTSDDHTLKVCIFISSICQVATVLCLLNQIFLVIAGVGNELKEDTLCTGAICEAKLSLIILNSLNLRNACIF
jgi:amino acid permease